MYHVKMMYFEGTRKGSQQSTQMFSENRTMIRVSTLSLTHKLWYLSIGEWESSI